MKIRVALRGLRKELGMSQADLAGALGVSAVTVNRWETGKNPPTRVMARAILSLAASQKASKTGQQALETALFPKPETPGMDELNGAQIAQINDLVNESSNGVFVCAADTYELLYINRQLCSYVNKKPESSAGQTCYNFLFGRNTPCEGCPMGEDEPSTFLSREYQSPSTGRHYITRSKSVSWAGRKAHIGYITDTTPIEKAREELVRSRELLAEACQESGLWMFSYNIGTDEAIFDEAVQRLIHLPGVLPHFFETIDKTAVVYPDYLPELQRVPARLKNGETSVELLLQTEFRSTTPHWLRMRGRVVARDEAGAPQTAIFSCQIIDREMTGAPRTGLARARAAMAHPAPAAMADANFETAPDSRPAASGRTVHEYRAGLASALLKNKLPGGIVGCYLEPGFPFYFINENMLGYLGYESEEAFVAATHGLVENAIFPEDLPAVEASVRGQIEKSGEYEVDYRMLKKDGSSIWVHEVGKKTAAEDGRDAILSTCVDVTEVKEHEHFLDGLVAGLNGDLMLIAVEEKTRHTIPLYTSEGMGRKPGLSQSEFVGRTTRNSMDFILPADQARVWEAILVALKNSEAAPSVAFRICGEDGKVKWMNASFARHGMHDGLPVLLALFTPSSVQYDLQQHVLDQNETGISAIDANTHEVYYANDAMFRLMGSAPQNYTGKSCPQVLGSCFGGCDNCPMETVLEKTPVEMTVKIQGRWVRVYAERRLWTDKEVVSLYASDVTEQTELRQTLERTNTDMAAVLKNATCGISVLDFAPDGTITPTYQSEALAKIVGVERQALPAWFARDPWLGADDAERPHLKKMMHQLLKNGGTHEETYRGHTAQGKLIWVQTSFHAVRKQGGGATLYTSCIDVSEKMTRQEQMQDVFSNVPGGVCLFRWDGEKLQPISVSRHFSDFYGIDGLQMLKDTEKTNYTLVHPDDLSGLQAYLAKCVQTPGEGYTYSYRVWNVKHKRYSWLRAIGNVIRRGDETFVYINYADVDAEKNMEMQLRRNMEINEAGSRFANVWTIGFDMDSDTVYPNKMLRESLSLPPVMTNFPESLLGVRCILPEYHATYLDAVRQMKEGAEHTTLEAQMWDGNNEIHWARIDFIRLSGNLFSPNYAISMARFIDREKEMQARLEIEQQKMVSYNPSLLRYVVLNLTLNTVVQERNFRPDAAASRIGMTMEEMLATVKAHAVQDGHWRQYLAVHDCKKLMELCNGGKTNFSIEGRHSTADGKTIWLRNVMNLMRDPDSGDVYLYEYAYDINDQKLQEEILQASATCNTERLARVNLDTGDLTRVMAQGEGQSLAMENGDYTEAYTQYCNAAVLPEDKEFFLNSIRLDTLRRELAKPGEYQFTHRVRENGTVRYKRSRFTVYDRENNIALMTRNDVTALILEQKKNAQERENLFIALRNTTPMMIVGNLTQNEFEIVRGKDFFAKPKQLRGRIEDLVAERAATIPGEDRQEFIRRFTRKNLLEAAERGVRQLKLEHRQNADDGTLHWVETQVLLTKNEEDGSVCGITLAQDITARKQQEQALAQAMAEAKAASNAKSEFLSRMSHEIRTPMNAIMGMTAIAKENTEDTMQVTECLDKIDLSSHFLLTLINDILEMSRIESGRTEMKHEAFDFDTLMRSICTVVEPLAAKASLRFECVTEGKTDATYRGDAMRLQQVLVNIITNAIKFTKAGGRVRFSTQIEGKTPQQSSFCFEVADTGIGMSEEFMQRMFDPFTQEDGSNTSQFGGSGLGLAIAKSLVEAMKGTISVESFPGVGTTFTIRLPLDRVSATVAPGPAARPEKKEADLGVLLGAKVLLAEDHPLNVMVARKLLENKGVRITVAENGKVAADIFAASAPGYFDAILMDIRMPVMDGWDATKTIRAMGRPDAAAIPIIAMTANALDEDRRHSGQVGMNDHLAKPFEPGQLYRVLAEQISAAHSKGEKQ